MKKIIVTSGGIDSTTLLYDLVDQFGAKNILALIFNYGSKHNQFEIPKAKKSCEILGVEFKEINLTSIFEHFNSALLKHENSEAIPEGHYQDSSMKKTVVPFRNGIMLSIAIGLAESINGDSVYYGAHAGDHQIYPDCRPLFIDAISLAGVEGTYNLVDVKAPYSKLDKEEILRRGLKIGVDYSLTHTCYNPDENGNSCGKCGSCIERLEAFEKNNQKDPLIYFNNETIPNYSQTQQGIKVQEAQSIIPSSPSLEQPIQIEEDVQF